MVTADRLKRAKKVSKRKETTSKKELRVIEIDVQHHPQIRKVCTLGFLIDQVKSPMDQHKKAVQAIFFDTWTEEMFAAQKKPDNFRVLLPKLDENGEPLQSLDDVRCTFQLKMPPKSSATRKAGIAKKLPNEDDLPKDETLQEVLIDVLKSDVVGLSPANAKKFVSEELLVIDKFSLADTLEEMQATPEDDLLHIISNMLLVYFQSRAGKKDKGMVSLPAFTDELEEAALVTVQVINLKDGMLNRIFTYCKNISQLRKLLRYCEVTLQIADFDFGMSDELAIKADRIKEAIIQYLIGDEE